MAAGKGKQGFFNGTLMNDKEVKSRRAADAKRADRGMLKELGKVRERKAKPEIDKLRAASKPLPPAAPDPNEGLVKADGLNPNEPSVESAEPNLVQMHRGKREWQGQR